MYVCMYICMYYIYTFTVKIMKANSGRFFKVIRKRRERIGLHETSSFEADLENIVLMFQSFQLHTYIYIMIYISRLVNE